ncbi:MAG: glycoside hydrolase family 3 C-terminal domain-containing protein, partial [Candidatus Acidiferrales bacterium]
HRALALRSARESIVLLKNDKGVLPLSPNVKTIAVIGPEANLVVALEGNYNGTPPNPVTPLLGIERRFGRQNTLVYAQGSKLVNEMPVPVPATALRPSRSDEETSALGGLTGEYFDNANLEGPPAMTRTDQSIDFDWAGLNPIPAAQTAKFSVRWTGTFTPPAPGDYRIGADIGGCYPCKDADDFRLYLDGKLLDERSTTPDLMIPVRFADRGPHKIRLEYSHSRGDMNRNLSFGGDAAGITLLWDPPAEALRNEAVAAAQKADVIVACVGISRDLENEENRWMNIPGFYGGDRTDIALPQPQQDLLKALAATGKPVIVVLMSGSAVAVDPDLASAILAAWYPGEEGGTAIAETIAGDNNPAGRLPVTFYKSVADLPPFDDYSMRGRTYRYFTGQPLFPFGFGLSYARFEYSALELSSTELDAGSSLEVEADVRNASPRDGDEVAELYIAFPKSDIAPIRALRGFTRLQIPAGQTRRVQFSLRPRDLSEVDEAGERIIAPGEYTISVGGGQPGSMLPVVESHFTITGARTLPK